MCIVASVEPLVLSNITLFLWRSDVDGDGDNQPSGLRQREVQSGDPLSPGGQWLWLQVGNMFHEFDLHFTVLSQTEVWGDCSQHQAYYHYGDDLQDRTQASSSVTSVPERFLTANIILYSFFIDNEISPWRFDMIVWCIFHIWYIYEISMCQR